MRARGASVRLSLQEGIFRVFAFVPELPQERASLNEINAFIADALARAGYKRGDDMGIVRRFSASSLAIMMALGAHASEAAPEPTSSILIDNAIIIDGTGQPRQRGDVRIEGDRIAATGDLTPRPGERVIDAHGLVLAPGFIDTHSHHSGGLDKLPDAPAVVSQGITTIVVGQDGGSAHPLAEFFAAFEKAPAAINIASYSGHNMIRRLAMDEDSEREATPAEIERMSAMLAADMDAGALGLSTGLEYDPGRSSNAAEVRALAGVAAKHGGRYISHLRSEDRALWEAVDELLAIGRETGMPVQISHAKLAMVDLWGQADKLLEKLDEARAAGIDVTIDVYPYTYWHSELGVLWPDRDFADRAKADYALTHLVKPEGLHFASFPAEPTLAGKTLAEIARARGADPVTVLIDMAQANDKAGGGARIVATAMDEADVAKLIAWDQANISSDGMLEGAHPRGTGAFPRVLRRFVREEKILSLEEAIRRMTSLAAAHMGLSDRGVIRPGTLADLVLFNPDTVADRSTIAEPALRAVGIERVWVNGTEVYIQGHPTGAHPGRVLRREPKP